MKTTALGWIAWLGVAICGLPYVALRLYLRGSMHADADAATLPGPWFLALLFVVGGGTAGLGLAAGPPGGLLAHSSPPWDTTMGGTSRESAGHQRIAPELFLDELLGADCR